MNWADQELKKGHRILPGKQGTFFEAFAAGFWSPDGEYITRALARGGHFSARLAAGRAAQLDKWILSHFKGRALSEHPEPRD